MGLKSTSFSFFENIFVLFFVFLTCRLAVDIVHTRIKRQLIVRLASSIVISSALYDVEESMSNKSDTKNLHSHPHQEENTAVTDVITNDQSLTNIHHHDDNTTTITGTSTTGHTNFDNNLIQIDGIEFVDYQDESQLHHVMSLVGRDLSEPYSSTSFFCC
jgi:hypothetical protein